MITLGYRASAEQFDARTLLDFGVRAEQAGFDSVVVGNQLQPWLQADGHALHPLAWMAALAQRTEKITIGNSAITPALGHHPSTVAQAIATLHTLTPDRILLGVGAGKSMNELAPLGIEWPEFEERLGRLREAVALMRLLWTEEAVTFDGDYYQTSAATMCDRPVPTPPIYIAAGCPTVARYAGSAGDGVICRSGANPDLFVDELLPAVAQGAKEAGRDTEAINRTIEVKVSFDPDPRRDPREQTRHWAALSLPAEMGLGVQDPQEVEHLAAELPIETVAEQWLVSTDANEHVEQIGKYIEMGFDHIVLHAPDPDQARFIKVYGRLILPRVRSRYQAAASGTTTQEEAS